MFERYFFKNRYVMTCSIKINKNHNFVFCKDATHAMTILIYMYSVAKKNVDMMQMYLFILIIYVLIMGITQ